MARNSWLIYRYFQVPWILIFAFSVWYRTWHHLVQPRSKRVTADVDQRGISNNQCISSFYIGVMTCYRENYRKFSPIVRFISSIIQVGPLRNVTKNSKLIPHIWAVLVFWGKTKISREWDFRFLESENKNRENGYRYRQNRVRPRQVFKVMV